MRNVTFALVMLVAVVILASPVIYGVDACLIPNHRGYSDAFFGDDGYRIVSQDGPVAQIGNLTLIGNLSYDKPTRMVSVLNFFEAPFFTPTARSVTSAKLHLEVQNPVATGNGNSSSQPSWVQVRFNGNLLINESLTLPVKESYYTWSLATNSANRTLAVSYPVDVSLIGDNNSLEVDLGPHAQFGITSVSLLMTTLPENLQTPHILVFPSFLVATLGLVGSAAMLLIVFSLTRNLAKADEALSQPRMP